MIAEVLAAVPAKGNSRRVPVYLFDLGRLRLILELRETLSRFGAGFDRRQPVGAHR